MRIDLPAALGLLFLEAACAQPSVPPPAVAPLQARIDEARGNLAARLAVPVTAVRVVSAAAVVWPNSSLGCPQPGMAYADALAQGYRVVLETGGREYEYHSTRTGQLAYCAEPTPPLPDDDRI